MKIFYYCYGRAHSSVIAGHIHLQTLPSNRLPTINEILELPEFDKSTSKDFGIPYFLGKDCQANEIFIIGFGNKKSLGLQTISFLISQHSNQMEWHFYNALENVGLLTKIGGFISQKLKIVHFGRYLVALGIRKSYFRLVTMVKSIKEIYQLTKRKIVVLTDGDRVAKKVVEKVAKNVGGRAISLSAGNPTYKTGEKIVEAVKKAAYDPVLVMVDDCGSRGEGPGERVFKELAGDSDIEILGVVAVASNTSGVEGVPVTASISRDGLILESPVDKDGIPEPKGHHKIEGDTVDVINKLNIPIVIGVGDLGKMDDADLVEAGAKITTIAVEEVLKRSGFRH